MTSPFFSTLMRRALSRRDPSLLQVMFDVAVISRYLDSGAFTVMRTDTVGRIKQQGGWTLDFGINPGGTQIHASWSALGGLPDDQLEHWAAHAQPPELSEMFVKMQLAPGSCFDDGDLRPWQTPPVSG